MNPERCLYASFFPTICHNKTRFSCAGTTRKWCRKTSFVATSASKKRFPKLWELSVGEVVGVTRATTPQGRRRPAATFPSSHRRPGPVASCVEPVKAWKAVLAWRRRRCCGVGQLGLALRRRPLCLTKDLRLATWIQWVGCLRGVPSLWHDLVG